MTTAAIAEHVGHYREQGFYFAEGMLSREEAKEILDQGMHLIKATEAPNRLMNPHREDDLFMRFFRHNKIVPAIEDVVAETAVGVQTMFYIKPPETTGHGWHQDQYYIPGDPKPILAAWCALDDIDEENGALTVFPGSHKLGMLEMKPHQDPNFKIHDKAIEPPAEIEPLTVCMKPGDVLFFDGLLIHGSHPNHSKTRFRRALVSHYLAEGSSGLWAGRGNEITPLHES